MAKVSRGAVHQGLMPILMCLHIAYRLRKKKQTYMFREQNKLHIYKDIIRIAQEAKASTASDSTWKAKRKASTHHMTSTVCNRGCSLFDDVCMDGTVFN